MWANKKRHPSQAPRDGSTFIGVKKYGIRPMRMVWCDDMCCFLTEHFSFVDELACWWPLKEGA